MAFSYSDKNFTVVGNLCFVHIKTTTSGPKSIVIPPALADRMLFENLGAVGVNYNQDGSSLSIVFASVEKGKIHFNPSKPLYYLNFHFPIDSNK